MCVEWEVHQEILGERIHIRSMLELSVVFPFARLKFPLPLRRRRVVHRHTCQRCQDREGQDAWMAL